MDKNILLGEIKKHGLTVTEICKLADISTSAFYKKLKGKSEFTRKEMLAIINILKLDDTQIPEIFFDKRVS